MSTPTLRELPSVQIHPHPEHDCAAFGSSGADEALLHSIERDGLMTPIVVETQGRDTYRIVDGHRRYCCARRLGITSLPCAVNASMSPGQYAYLRFVLNDTKPWTLADTARWSRRNKKLIATFPADVRQRIMFQSVSRKVTRAMAA